MKCPLLKITRPGLMRAEAFPQDNCLKEECAWWVKEVQCCCLTRIDERLGEIGYELSCIKHALYTQLGEEAKKEIIEEVAKD
jgi:hypothetical protein